MYIIYYYADMFCNMLLLHLLATSKNCKPYVLLLSLKKHVNIVPMQSRVPLLQSVLSCAQGGAQEIIDASPYDIQ